MHQPGEVPLNVRVFSLIILNAMIAVSLHAGSSIAIESCVVPREVSLGDPLRLSVVLRNVGNESVLLLARDTNFVVEVDSHAGMQTIRAPRYTRRAAPFRDDEVPLRPGDAFTREIPVQLNDLRATLGEGWVGVPGAYRVRVRYDSKGSVQERPDLVWQGAATSNWTNVRVRAPSEKKLMQRLTEIEKCIGSDECDSIPLANFFRVIRDDRAPDVLLRLIERRPYDIWLLDAIIFQSRASDAKRLRAIATTVDDPSIRQRFIDAAAKLERFGTTPRRNTAYPGGTGLRGKVYRGAPLEPVDGGTVLSVPGDMCGGKNAVTGVVDQLAFTYNSTTPEIAVATWNGTGHTVRTRV